MCIPVVRMVELYQLCGAAIYGLLQNGMDLFNIDDHPAPLVAIAKEHEGISYAEVRALAIMTAHLYGVIAHTDTLDEFDLTVTLALRIVEDHRAQLVKNLFAGVRES